MPSLVGTEARPSAPSAGFLVLEGYGGPGESSTDDDILASAGGKQLRSSRGCAADSGINLRFSTASQAGSLSSFSRRVLSHLRNLQANLNYLKVWSGRPGNTDSSSRCVSTSCSLFVCFSQDVEAKYNNLIRQRPERSAADADGNKGTSIRRVSVFIMITSGFARETWKSHGIFFRVISRPGKVDWKQI